MTEEEEAQKMQIQIDKRDGGGGDQVTRVKRYGSMFLCICVHMRGRIGDEGLYSNRVTLIGRGPGQTDRDGMGCLSICNPRCNPWA